MKLSFSKETYSTIILLLCSLFISLLLSNVPFFVNMQNRGYYHKIINDYSYLSSKEGLTDISANNIINSILNDANTVGTPFEQLLAIRHIVGISVYPTSNYNKITGILDASGNSDNTKIQNTQSFIKNYIVPNS